MFFVVNLLSIFEANELLSFIFNSLKLYVIPALGTIFLAFITTLVSNLNSKKSLTYGI